MTIRLLFDSAITASEVAFQLQGIYDGCNSVTFDSEFEELDISAIKFVVDSLGGDFCLEKTFCFCSNQSFLGRIGSGKSIMMCQTIKKASQITATCATRINFNHEESAKVEIEIALKFLELVEQWRRETYTSSNPRVIIDHPAYQKIIKMGKPVIPLILRELERRPSLWFTALSTITGENPSLPEFKWNTRLLREAWLKWGRE